MVEIGKGKNKYLVALCVGGKTGMPQISYENHQIVHADNEEQARKIYNKHNNCSYYYGSVIAELK